jgi:hypothetical protein
MMREGKGLSDICASKVCSKGNKEQALCLKLSESAGKETRLQETRLQERKQRACALLKVIRVKSKKRLQGQKSRVGELYIKI